jgi:hypothetical protein
MGVTTESGFSATLRHGFKILITSEALRFHGAVRARFNACLNAKAIRNHVPGGSFQAMGQSDVAAQAQRIAVTGSGTSVVAAGAIAAGTTTNTENVTLDGNRSKGHHVEEVLLANQEGIVKEEAESAEVRGRHPYRMNHSADTRFMPMCLSRLVAVFCHQEGAHS